VEELKRRLTKELQQDFNVKILDSLSWGLPIHSIEIAYQTVKRTQMDILMKMMLLAFQTEEIADAEELSDILLVEQLFINDLIEKMSRTGVLETKGTSFKLTEAGIQQQDSGLFVNEPEEDSKKALYSPSHQDFLAGDIENLSSDEGLETYRYHKEFADWTVKSLAKTDAITALQSLGVESSEGDGQIVISKIVSATNVQTDEVPCLEFRLYNKTEDVLYARVWNTLLERWDGALEAQLNEQERKEWRESYL
jgi:hypothetical protein